jgi:hypothetical protein
MGQSWFSHDTLTITVTVTLTFTVFVTVQYGQKLSYRDLDRDNIYLPLNFTSSQNQQKSKL